MKAVEQTGQSHSDDIELFEFGDRVDEEYRLSRPPFCIQTIGYLDKKSHKDLVKAITEGDSHQHCGFFRENGNPFIFTIEWFKTESDVESCFLLFMNKDGEPSLSENIKLTK